MGNSSELPDEDLRACAITRDLILAGHAIMTADNGHGSWYTFLVEKSVGAKGTRWEGTVTSFVKLLHGSDNSDRSSYHSVGILRPDTGYLKLTEKSPKGFLKTETGWAWLWLADCLWGRKSLAYFPKAAIRHAGFCKCGHRLTTPESIRHGMGPHCRREANSTKGAWEAEDDGEEDEPGAD